MRPRATLAPGAALRTYHASVLPFGSPIDRAYASLGWTWMERGSLVKSSLSRSEGRKEGLPGRSYQISPIATPVWLVLFQGRRSTTPQGFGRACVSASSIVMMLRQRENFGKPGRVSGKRVASVASETTQMISTIDQAVLHLRTVANGGAGARSAVCVRRLGTTLIEQTFAIASWIMSCAWACFSGPRHCRPGLSPGLPPTQGGQ